MCYRACYILFISTFTITFVYQISVREYNFHYACYVIWLLISSETSNEGVEIAMVQRAIWNSLRRT